MSIPKVMPFVGILVSQDITAFGSAPHFSAASQMYRRVVI